MKKIIHSMFHGNSRTRLFLWGLFFIGLAAVFAAGLAFVLGKPLYGGISVILLFAFFVVSQSFSLKDLEKSKKRKNISPGKKLPKEAPLQSNPLSMSEPQEEAAGEEEEENYFANYDAGMLKKLFHRYKVKKDHRTVIIDESKEWKIEQCPAFVWKENGKFHVLLLEKEPRKIEIPISQIKEIGYHKAVEARPDKEYLSLKKATLVGKVFRSHLPAYKEKVEGGRQRFYKNLYVVGEQFEITSTSAKNVFDILGVPFVIQNEVTKSARYSSYFKQAYIQSVLCQDLVITKGEFTENMAGILEELASSDIPESNFMQTLQNMARFHFAGQEEIMACRERRRQNNLHNSY